MVPSFIHAVPHGSLPPALSWAKLRKEASCHVLSFLDNTDGFQRINLGKIWVTRKIEKFETSPQSQPFMLEQTTNKASAISSVCTSVGLCPSQKGIAGKADFIIHSQNIFYHYEKIVSVISQIWISSFCL